MYQLLLRPNVVYELPDKADLLLGDTKATYNYIHGKYRKLIDPKLTI